MPSAIKENIEQLQIMVSALLKQLHAAQGENNKLRTKLEVAGKQIDTLNTEKEQWMQKSTALSSGVKHLPEADKKALQKKIDSYLSAIDKCLLALNAK